MGIIIYLVAGVIFECFVIWSYFTEKAPYTKTEIVVGGIIDIVLWPIVLLKNIIEWGR